MADGQIKIRISAQSDRSIDTVFGSIEKRAQKARDNINRSLGGSSSTSALAAPLAAAAKQNDLAAKASDKAWNQQLKALNNYAREQDRTFKRAAQERVKVEATANRARLKDEQETSRAIVREFKNQVRQREQEYKQAEREEVRTRRNFAERTSHRATKFLFPPPIGILGAGKRIAGDILRGAGIDMSIAGGVSRTISLQGGGVQIANQERIATGKSKGGNFYSNLARDTGAERSVDPSQVMGMMNSFTAKTGEFDGVAKIAGKLASLGTASGANLTEMGDAAGYVYNQLSALPDAGERTIEVMRGIIGQTAVGAVDMPDYAKQLGRIAANASKFEGNVGDNIRGLSALAQLSIESGGASSPADAARAVGSFANTFGKSARIAAFKKEGVKLFTDDKQDTLRAPIEVIKDSFRNTKGNIPKLANLFADTLGRKPVTALGNAYKAAGGGEAGIAAVQAKYDKYMKAQLTADVEQKNNADYAASPAAKAQRFQNNLDKVVASAAEKVFPALEKLAPQALQLASALGKLTGYVAENPIRAVILAIVAAIGRAGLESALRTGIEKMIMGSANGFLPGRGIDPTTGKAFPGAAGGGAFGTMAGKGFMALGAGLSGYAIGSAGGSALFGQRGGEMAGAVLGGAAFGGQLAGPWGAAAGAATGAAVDQAQNLARYTEGWGGIGAGVEGLFTKGSFFDGVDDYQNQQAKKRRMVEDDAVAHGASPEEAAAKAQGKAFDQAALSQGVADGMAARTLKVQVVNAKDFATAAPATGPKVGAAGRAAP